MAGYCDPDFWAEQAERAPCVRCGHQRSYHGQAICGQEVCAVGPHGGGGYCDDEMHGNGWCQCPSWVGDEEELYDAFPELGVTAR